MSYIEKARQNRITAEKAAAFDKMQQDRREQDVYTRGSNDAYSSVEQELLRRAERQAMPAVLQTSYGSPSGLLSEVDRYMQNRSGNETPRGLAGSLLP